MTMEKADMIIAMLILAALVLAALNVLEAYKNYTLRKRNAEYMKENREFYLRIGKLTSENAALNERCEQFANENATLASENARLQECSFGVMMREWKRIEDGECIYYEKDHIRLIVEDGKVVGWYRP